MKHYLLTQPRRLQTVLLAAALLGVGSAARAQFDYSAYGVADFSYGRFEPSGFQRAHRFNSNSMTASFVGVNASYDFEGGWKPGITLETFLRFHDAQTGRSESDPQLSRKAFVSLTSDYGTLSLGRVQTLLFDTTVRFNALGNSVAFSPAIRHVFASGDLEGVQGDFYWNRTLAYVSPLLFDSLTVSAMHGRGRDDGDHNRLNAANMVFSRGVFAAALTWQQVELDNRVEDATRESTWQLGSSYNFGWARVFGTYSHTDDRGLNARSKLLSAGVAVPFGPGTVLFQAGQAQVDGPAVERKHTTVSGAYLYEWDSVTHFYVVAMDDRVRGQTEGKSLAIGLRYSF